jgi:uncharacterized protein (DUF608 family)
MKSYAGKETAKISFPLGGIGTGCIGLSGSGRLIDWEILNRPNKLSYNGMSHFAVKAETDGEVIDARILHGEFLGDLTGSPNCFGFGAQRESLVGVPHFRNWKFQGNFPFAKLVFSDEHFPGTVTLTAFNPFIPLNDRDSSIPCAMFEIEIENTTARDIRYTVALVAANPWPRQCRNEFTLQHHFSMMTLTNMAVDRNSVEYGDLTLATDSPEVSYQENWFKGSWFDALGVYWRELNTAGPLANRSYGNIPYEEGPGGLPDGKVHATLAAHLSAVSEASCSTRMVIAWNVPNCNNNWDDKLTDGELAAAGLQNQWKNYYATQWSDSRASAAYVLRDWDRLKGDSRAFSNALHDTSVPEVFVEAAAANLAVLKSPTCLRLEDGSFYGFEGCTTDTGCCEGSCMHVWNYAYALPYLFPKLERSMRDLEYRYNLNDTGEMPFRLMLPLGRESRFRACADGQFGTIVKVYREWQISGDDAWLKQLWPKVKMSLEYAWHPDNADRWDPEQSGVLTGRQHHTLDMELFGPNSWLTGFYLVALKAAAKMAEFVGDAEFATQYREIFEKGRATLNHDLYNGEYFQQRVDLTDRTILDPFAAGNGCQHKDQTETVFEAYWNEEHGELKYQIGDGCEIDQILGQWHANLLGLGDIVDRDKAVSALRAIYRHNFKPSMREHFNPCRLYCVEDEAGTVMCDWPEGHTKPWVPLTYAEETMHGFEYALAGQMVQYGLLDEAERIVKAVRDRYNGANRNPWNEIECGSNYARSMAAFAFIPAFAGFHCDMSKGELAFDPIMDGTTFRSFWAAGSAWGTVSVEANAVVLKVLYGELTLQRLRLPFWRATTAELAGETLEYHSQEGGLRFADALRVRLGESLTTRGKLWNRSGPPDRFDNQNRSPQTVAEAVSV